jgi:hypothetical protein
VSKWPFATASVSVARRASAFFAPPARTIAAIMPPRNASAPAAPAAAASGNGFADAVERTTTDEPSSTPLRFFIGCSYQRAARPPSEKS